jgi:hypothetical protein
MRRLRLVTALEVGTGHSCSGPAAAPLGGHAYVIPIELVLWLPGVASYSCGRNPRTQTAQSSGNGLRWTRPSPTDLSGRCAAGAQQSDLTLSLRLFRYGPAQCDLVYWLSSPRRRLSAPPSISTWSSSPPGSRSVPVRWFENGRPAIGAALSCLLRWRSYPQSQLTWILPALRRALDYRRDSDSRQLALHLFRRSSCEHLVMCNPGGHGTLRRSRAHARLGPAGMGANGNRVRCSLHTRLGLNLARLT